MCPSWITTVGSLDNQKEVAFEISIYSCADPYACRPNFVSFISTFEVSLSACCLNYASPISVKYLCSSNLLHREQHWMVKTTAKSPHVINNENLLSRLIITLSTLWEPLIKKERHPKRILPESSYTVPTHKYCLKALNIQP